MKQPFVWSKTLIRSFYVFNIFISLIVGLLWRNSKQSLKLAQSFEFEIEARYLVLILKNMVCLPKNRMSGSLLSCGLHCVMILDNKESSKMIIWFCQLS